MHRVAAGGRSWKITDTLGKIDGCDGSRPPIARLQRGFDGALEGAWLGGAPFALRSDRSSCCTSVRSSRRSWSRNRSRGATLIPREGESQHPSAWASANDAGKIGSWGRVLSSETIAYPASASLTHDRRIAMHDSIVLVATIQNPCRGMMARGRWGSSLAILQTFQAFHGLGKFRELPKYSRKLHKTPENSALMLKLSSHLRNKDPTMHDCMADDSVATGASANAWNG